MIFGIAFDLKPDSPPPSGAPDDLYEEFDAPSTIQSIADVITGMGHTVEFLGDGPSFLDRILKLRPDFVFNFAEGTGTGRSRESRVPAVCEMLDIPYTGSDPVALGIALDKDLTRRVAADAGVIVPLGFVLTDVQPNDAERAAAYASLLAELGMAFPVIAKPTFEGSSKGIRNRCVIHTAADFGDVVHMLWTRYRQPVLIEEFITGMEVTVGLLGNDPPDVLGVMSIAPKEPAEHFVYSVEVKRDYLNLINYSCPAALSAGARRAVEQAALTVFDALGCRDVARLDFRIRDHVPYFIEINPLPGLNPESSDLVIMAGLLNMSYATLVERIVTAAMQRNRIAS
jgi:D-alanine-D-alanine ligase